jgi:hypothetical protein
MTRRINYFRQRNRLLLGALLVATLCVCFVVDPGPVPTQAHAREIGGAMIGRGGAGGAYCSQPTLEPKQFKGVRLALKDRVVVAGDAIYARIENLGTAPIRYTAPFRIERLVGSTWALDPASPSGPWPRYLGVVTPGSASRCSSFPVSAEIVPGRYRIAKTVGEGKGSDTVSRPISAPFQVLRES